MTRQIAVRLDDTLVEFVDAQVKAGKASSRADLVTRALLREQRRRNAERDAELLAAGPPAEEFDGLARSASTTPLDIV